MALTYTIKPLVWEDRIDCLIKSFDETGLCYTIEKYDENDYHVMNNISGYDCFSYRTSDLIDAIDTANDHRLFMAQAMLTTDTREARQAGWDAAMETCAKIAEIEAATYAEALTYQRWALEVIAEEFRALIGEKE